MDDIFKLKEYQEYLDLKKTIFYNKADFVEHTNRQFPILSNDLIIDQILHDSSVKDIKFIASKGSNIHPFKIDWRIFRKDFEEDEFLNISFVRDYDYLVFDSISKLLINKVPHSEILRTEINDKFVGFTLDYQLSKYIDGIRYMNYENSGLNINKVIKMLNNVHSIKTENFGWLNPTTFVGMFDKWSDFLNVNLDWHIDSCKQMGAIKQNELKEIVIKSEKILPYLNDIQPVLIHGDPTAPNFIAMENGDYALVDWEDAFSGDEIYEMALLATFCLPNMYNKIMEDFYINRNKPDNFEIRFWFYFLRIALAKTVHRHRFNIENRPNMPPASKRIQFALEKLNNLC
jgi:thiamine kinase-like enzyme